MKKAVLALFGLAAFTATPVLAGEFQTLDTIDAQKVKASPWCSWVEAANWPTVSMIRTRAYTGDLTPEKTALIQTLQRVVKKDCLPPESLVRQKAVGITTLRNGNDALLLQYKTRNGFDIRVSAERELIVLVDVPKEWRKPLPEVTSLVWRTAEAVLAFPEFDGKGPGKPEFIIPKPGTTGGMDLPRLAPNVPLIVGSLNDIGRSEVGGLLYGQKGPSSYGDSWYSTIKWWSDGQRVMFSIRNLTEAEIEELRTMAAPRPVAPRVFLSRKAE